MKIALYTPWNNRWKADFSKAFADRGHDAFWIDRKWEFHADDLPDAVFAMWADEWTLNIFRALAGKTKLLSYIRSYEMYHPWPAQIDWSPVSAVFFCAPQVQHWSEHYWGDRLPKARHMVHNWVDPRVWPWKWDIPKDPGKIAMVGNINGKKGFELAVQIMAELPKNYTLDVAGDVQDPMIFHYLVNIIHDLGLQDRITFHGPVPWEKVSDFLQDKSIILSTSLKEGCPMNVIEGMASGCTPVIHHWAGATDIFHRERVFKTVAEAVEMIQRPADECLDVRAQVLSRFNVDINCALVVDKALEAING